MKDLRPFDMHCDTLMALGRGGDIDGLEAMVNLRRMEEAKVLVQCFAIFVPIGRLPGQAACDEAYAKRRDSFHAMLSAHPDRLRQIRSVADIEACAADGKLGCMLTIEDSGVLGDDPAKVDAAYRDGVRIASLTWNFENAMAYPQSPEPEKAKLGLKQYGFDFVSHCDELGIVLDVSHLNDGGFWDVVKATKNPFVATHSNCRAVTDHPRNLTDDMIRALADKGGVMGINLWPAILGPDNNSRVEDMVRHVQHMLKVGGEGVLALGSDFDGFDGDELEVSGPEEFIKLARALEKAGFTPRQIDMMWNENAMRVMRDVIG